MVVPFNPVITTRVPERVIVKLGFQLFVAARVRAEPTSVARTFGATAVGAAVEKFVAVNFDPV